MARLIYSVEDDIDISKIIATTLQKGGYNVVSFSNGESFMQEFRKKKPDMILLDIMLPDCSGLDLLKEIKSEHSNENIQVIIISARNNPIDKVDGLDSGADDYIGKPFDILELLSRVNARFRRAKFHNEITYKNITLNADKRTCIYLDNEVSLTNMEFEILFYLLSNIGRAITRDELFNHIYGSTMAIESRTLDMHIKAIRKKIGDENAEIIKTIYGVGYLVS